MEMMYLSLGNLNYVTTDTAISVVFYDIFFIILFSSVLKKMVLYYL